MDPATELAWAEDGYRPDLPFDLAGNGPSDIPTRTGDKCCRT